MQYAAHCLGGAAALLQLTCLSLFACTHTGDNCLPDTVLTGRAAMRVSAMKSVYVQVFKGMRGGEPVAVKVLDGMDARALRDFKHEVAFLMNLHHSYVVQFLGACIQVCTAGCLCCGSNSSEKVSILKMPIWTRKRALRMPLCTSRWTSAEV